MPFPITGVRTGRQNKSFENFMIHVPRSIYEKFAGGTYIRKFPRKPFCRPIRPQWLKREFWFRRVIFVIAFTINNFISIYRIITKSFAPGLYLVVRQFNDGKKTLPMSLL